MAKIKQSMQTDNQVAAQVASQFAFRCPPEPIPSRKSCFSFASSSATKFGSVNAFECFV